ncbi:MAG: hypothetical protein JJP05_05850 [cyanobacterium endosymbiont of Rhopalodia gibba]|jgi:hypothetical protein
MEPCRGFPLFMETVTILQKRQPNCNTVVVGRDIVAYGRSLPDGKTCKQLILETFSLDLSRLHFTGWLVY